jgi:hypothetical protein
MDGNLKNPLSSDKVIVKITAGWGVLNLVKHK